MPRQRQKLCCRKSEGSKSNNKVDRGEKSQARHKFTWHSIWTQGWGMLVNKWTKKQNIMTSLAIDPPRGPANLDI